MQEVGNQISTVFLLSVFLHLDLALMNWKILETILESPVEKSYVML